MASLKVFYRRGPDRVTVYEQELLYDGQLIASSAPFLPSASLRAQILKLEDQE